MTNIKLHPTLSKALRRRLGEEEGALKSERILREVTSVVALLNSSSKSNNKLGKYLAYFSVSLSAVTISKSLYDAASSLRGPNEFTIKIAEEDALFQISEKWLMDALPDDKKLSIYAATYRVDDYHIAGTGSKNKAIKVRTSYDGSIEQEVHIGGHDVKVSTSVPESQAKSSDAKYKAKSDRTIVFTCYSAAARDAVLEELRRQAQALRTMKPGFYNSRWGSFDRVSDVPTRSKDTVVLKPGQMDRILGHITTFRENEKTYKDIGVPFRTGIMFYGPPGSGKSSTASVIAHEMGMDLYYISLRSTDDEQLINSVANIPANSLVILEDIDVCKGVKDRETTDDAATNSEVSMSTVLNVLDGFQSPPGVVFIMTTNRLDVIDAAIIRPGRVDLLEELGFLDNDQLHAMVELYIGSVPEDLPSISEADKISSADIVGVVRKHIPHIEAAAPDIVAFITEKVLTSEPI